MAVTVTLLAIQSSTQPGDKARTGPRRQIDVTLLSGSTLAEPIRDLGVELSLRKTVLEVNGRPTELHTVLHDGDLVNLSAANPDGQVGS